LSIIQREAEIFIIVVFLFFRYSIYSDDYARPNPYSPQETGA